MPNWSDVDNAAPSQSFKNYAGNGDYTVKLEKATMFDKDSWKSPAVEFEWQENDEYKFPKSPRHFLSLNNPNWRLYHMRALLMAFGVPKTTAEQWLDKAETDNRKKLVANYQALFDKVAAKHPEVAVVVRTQMRDGKPVVSPNGTAYGETELAPSTGCYMSQDAPKTAPTQTVADDLFGSDDVISDEDVPF